MARDWAYEEAEKKIVRAWESRATKLNLSGMGLSELPESLSQLTKKRGGRGQRNLISVAKRWRN